MTDEITYEQLHEKLRALGYSHRSVQVNGRQGEVFEHKTIPNAMITLPKRNSEEKVEPFYMNSVMGILKSRNVVRDEDPLEIS